MDNGHIVVQDLRGGTSKLNLNINVFDTNNQNTNNIFGVFNTIVQGGGINVFDSFDNAQAAILGQSINQISNATGFIGGSTLTPIVSGYYTGNNSVQWTFSVNSVSTSLISSPHTILIQDSKGNNVAQITMGILSSTSNTFKISVTDANGDTIFTASKAVNNINDIASFLNNTYIELPDGIKIKLTPQKSPDGSYILPVLNNGDSFSVNLTNMLQQSITNIQNSLSQVDANRSIIGAYEQRMQLAQTRINNTSLSNSQTLSNLQDANYAQVISNYVQEIIIMQALLQSFAKVNQLSLFNYI